MIRTTIFSSRVYEHLVTVIYFWGLQIPRKGKIRADVMLCFSRTKIAEAVIKKMEPLCSSCCCNCLCSCLKVYLVWIRRWDLTSFLHASDSCCAFILVFIHGYLLFPAFHAAKCSVTSTQKGEIKYLWSDQIKPDWLKRNPDNWSINLPVHVDVTAITQATVTKTASVEKMGRL